jgi:hypothetical protein
MASEVVSKKIHPDMDIYIHSISWVASPDCGVIAGKQLTGGKPTVINGTKVVHFQETYQGKGINVKYENKPDLAALVEQYNALEAEEETKRETKRAAKRAEQEAIEKPLLEAMKTKTIELQNSIPTDHVEVTVVKAGDSDGYPILDYFVDGFKLNWQDVNIIGWASATYPGAMAPFAEKCIASIDRVRLQELKEAKEAAEQKKAEAEKAAEAELAAKFEQAKTTGEKVLLRKYSDECNDPNEECSIDMVYEWAMPDGTIKATRQHTW